MTLKFFSCNLYKSIMTNGRGGGNQTQQIFSCFKQSSTKDGEQSLVAALFLAVGRLSKIFKHFFRVRQLPTQF